MLYGRVYRFGGAGGPHDLMRLAAEERGQALTSPSRALASARVPSRWRLEGFPMMRSVAFQHTHPARGRAERRE